MCGIIGYVGGKSAAPILLDGLEKLEYRGYDSAGIAVINSNELNVIKTAKRIATTVIKLFSPNLTFTSSSVDLPINYFSFMIVINVLTSGSPSLIVEVVDFLCRKRPFDKTLGFILGDNHKIVVVVIKF